MIALAEGIEQIEAAHKKAKTKMKSYYYLQKPNNEEI
jgi:hypothetical protein